MLKIGTIKIPFRDKIFDLVNYSLMILLMFIMLYPFYNTVVVSFNDAVDGIRGSLYFFPRKISLYNYTTLFTNDNLLNAFFMSVAKTVSVTIINLFMASLTAYILSRKDYIFRKFFTVFLILTMYVNAGLIPQYFVAKDLGLINKFWVYIIPTALSAFNVIVIRTFINSLPESLSESARIDGAGDFRIYLQIILPLCKPILATVALWVVVGTWNSWFDTFIYAPSKKSLSTMQYEMMKLLSSSFVQSAAPDPGLRQNSAQTVTPNSMRAAMTIITSLPIICVYPFLQKYFVNLQVGGIKG